MFNVGDKCLYLFDGAWVPCEIVTAPEVLGGGIGYTGKCENGLVFWCGGDQLKPLHTLNPKWEDRRLKPREFSETVPAPMSLDLMIRSIKNFPRTFVDSGDEGINHGI